MPVNLMEIQKTKKRLIIGISLTILSSCTHYVYVYKSQWPENKIIVDGKIPEWKIPLKFYDDKSKLQYAIANDKENLYVCIRATDEQTQMKMFTAGMQVLIDTSENSNKSHTLPSVLFPQGMKRGNEGAIKETMMKEILDINTFKNRRSLELTSLELAGFNPDIKTGIYPLQNDYGISASIVVDSSNKILNYEAVIPFKTFYKNALSLADSSKIISVTIILNGLPMPSGGMPSGGGHPSGGGRMSDMAGISMGGGYGGGTPNGNIAGGMPSGNMDGGMEPGGDAEGQSSFGAMASREYLSQKNTIKTQFQFALKR